jgi:hypothetical protein
MATRVWFKLQGAASADYVLMPTDALVADLREKVKEKLAGPLQDIRGRPVSSSELILSTTNADGKTATYDDPEAPVPAAHQKAAQALIVTSAFACLACCAPAADFRRSCGPTHHWPGSWSGPCR